MLRVRLTGCLLAALPIAAGCTRVAEAPAPGETAKTTAPVAAFPAGELVDLSHPYEPAAIFWPTAEPFRLEKVADGITPGGYYYAANNLFTSEHGGTHMDAPVHFAEGHPAADQVPLDRLIGPALVIDVTEPSAANRDYQITVQDFTAWEQRHGRIPPNAIVLLRTGFSRRWPDAAEYLGTAERGEAAVAKLHFPGLHPDAARWIVEQRPIRAIGIDTASIDYGQSSEFQSHRVLYAADIPAFENLDALDRLPITGAYLIALPMKIKGGSGAPLRAVAILPSGG
jgi:kynurenine formamidase